jgi:hypothetical protein
MVPDGLQHACTHGRSRCAGGSFLRRSAARAAWLAAGGTEAGGLKILFTTFDAEHNVLLAGRNGVHLLTRQPMKIGVTFYP